MESRVNISMYFNFTVEEDRILKIQKEIENKDIQEIESIRYISRKQALDDFVKREGDNEEIKEALEMLEGNPMPASLVITAHDIADYEKINTYLHQEYGKDILETNHDRNKGFLTKIYDMIVYARNVCIVLGILFVLIAVLVTLNTIRMSLYAHRKEFEIMRLVGASNLYVKLPTLVEGILYGFVSALCTSAVLVSMFFAVMPFIKKLVRDIDTSSFYGQLGVVVALVICVGVFLGYISSAISIRRYLER
ncbi:MAG: hypothetical protein CR954_00825 [Candidatus Moraniibacteriota bacterium]|nr:MAG: hypothetical protein CR954_00825 [Candidatus Moranbacteria bacterium]